MGEREKQVAAAYLTGSCHCGGEMERVSKHERDSSNDEHRCNACGFDFGEMEGWGASRDVKVRS